MKTTPTFALALFAAVSASGTGATAAPVETAVSEWISAIDAAPDWKASFADLTYDDATDTAVLSGLTVAYAPAGVALSFEPITIAGYAEAADGTFGAQAVATDGATATGDGFEASLRDIRYEDLENLTDDLEELTAWDPERPFTSLMRAYARFLDVRLGRAEIGSMSMTAENDGEQVVFTYEDIAFEDWADGKIESITTGPLTMAAAGTAEPFSMTVVGTEARGIDYAAFMRIYDPDQYVGGVGDGIWRNAAEFIGYDTIVFDVPEAKVTFGQLTMENFKVRQPEKSFNDFFDRAMLAPQEQVEPTPKEMRAMFGYLSSFAVGATSLTDVHVEADDGGRGHLGEMRLIDASAERVGEFSLEDITASPPDQGKVEVGRIAFGGIVFPQLEALLEAAEAEQTGQEFDYAKLATKLAFFETSDIDIDVPDSPHVKLGKSRLDLGNYVGPIPTSAALEVVDMDFPADAIEDPKARAMWQSLGYDRVRGDFLARFAWNESDESIAIEDFRFSLDDVGALSFSTVLSGLSREMLENLETTPDQLLNSLNFVRGALSIEDYAVLDRWIDQQVELSGMEPTALRLQVGAMLARMASGVGDDTFQDQLRRVIAASIMTPGPVTATATPSAPIPLIALGVLAQTAPANLPDLLGLTITSDPAP